MLSMHFLLYLSCCPPPILPPTLLRSPPPPPPVALQTLNCCCFLHLLCYCYHPLHHISSTTIPPPSTSSLFTPNSLHLRFFFSIQTKLIDLPWTGLLVVLRPLQVSPVQLVIVIGLILACWTPWCQQGQRLGRLGSSNLRTRRAEGSPGERCSVTDAGCSQRHSIPLHIETINPTFHHHHHA